MNSVFAKWKSARTELAGKVQVEEEEEEREDLETIKQTEIERWKKEQIQR